MAAALLLAGQPIAALAQTRAVICDKMEVYAKDTGACRCADGYERNGGTCTAIGPPAKRPPATARAAKPVKRPLLRIARVQFCLGQLALYAGGAHGRATDASLRALRKYRNAAGLKARDDIWRDHALHAALWSDCRPRWTTRVAAMAARSQQAPPLLATIAATAAEVAGVRAAVTPGNAGLALEAGTASDLPQRLAITRSAPPPAAGPLRHAAPCLPAELKDMALRLYSRRVDAETCAPACLQMPPGLAGDDARGLERKHGFEWCRRCVALGAHLPLDDIQRIEQAGGIQLCRDVRGLAATSREPPARIVQDAIKGVRAIFQRDLAPAARHSNVAVLIGNAQYGGRAGDKPSAERSAAAFQLLLTERLGYRPENVLVVREASRADLERILGPVTGGTGAIAAMLRALPGGGDGASVLVVYAGHGIHDEDGGDGFLLAADAQPRKIEQTGYPLQVLYQNLQRLPGAGVTLVLEAEFSRNPGALALVPNAPEGTVAVLPARASRALTVLSAGDRDQKTLDDPESGLGLFTRYLLEGLSGAADVAPIGNADGIVDTLEAYLYAASRTMLAARKSFGVLQKPTLSQLRPAPLVRLGSAVQP